MSDLIIHPKTKEDICNIVSAKPHAILVIGANGIGKKSLAKIIVRDLLQASSLDNYPYVLTISAEDKSIGIEKVRQIEHFLSLKVPVEKTPNRAVIIEDGGKLTREAQNSLLKTLEEPPEDSVILLTLTHSSVILPTLVSRSQKLNVIPPDETSLKQYYKNIDDNQFSQAYLISGGLPGLLTTLLQNDEHPLQTATNEARTILSKNLYERTLMVNNLAKDPSSLMDTFQIMEQMATVSLKRGVNTERWEKVLKASYEARINLSKNAQTKLTLMKLMLSL